MTLDDLRVFVATIEEGSFTRAAEREGVSKQYISRRTMALEDALGVRLLNRTTRRLTPTELGLTLLDRARRILADVDDTFDAVAGQGALARGTLRISAPMTFGTLHLGALLPEFMRQHPLITIELDLNDRPVDIIAEGYDMAIRVGELADSSHIARRLATMQLITCASPDYLARHKLPDTPDDLAGHACLLYGHQRQVEWPFEEHGQRIYQKVNGPLRTNNGEIVLEAARAGLGIAHLPTFITRHAMASGELCQVLTAWQPRASAVHALYPRHRQSARAVQALADYLQDALRAGTVSR